MQSPWETCNSKDCGAVLDTDSSKYSKEFTQKEFNHLRRIMWSVLERLLHDYDEQYTTADYFEDATGEGSHPRWCEKYPSALHIFTRYYPYTEQPVTLVLDNPRLDYNGDADAGYDQDSEDKFPTLEHRRYSRLDSTEIQRLSQVSAEGYNSYFYNKKGWKRSSSASGK